MLNIVCGYHNIVKFKTSKHFAINLGLVATVEKDGSRTYNSSDKFALFYNTNYKTTLYGQGNVGNVRFYTDHYIRDDSIAVYYGDNFEEFIFQYDAILVSKKGIDFYIGRLLKESSEKYLERKNKEELRKLEPKAKGDANKIFSNPGNVRYDDLKEYIKNKRGSL